MLTHDSVFVGGATIVANECALAGVLYRVKQNGGNIVNSTIKPSSTIFDAGMAARRQGLSVKACPHCNGSDEHRAWTDGWHEGDALDQDNALDDERFMPRET